MKLDIFYCEKCGLYSAGKSENEVKESVTELYESEYWRTTSVDGNNYNRVDDTKANDEGKKRNWISQYSYCKQYLLSKKIILDVGSGLGHALVWFEEEGHIVTGIEPDPKNVELINKKLNQGNCIHGYVEEIDLNTKFDIIWMSHVLEHLIRPDLFLEKIKNNLKKNSIFFIEVPDCENNETFHDSLLAPHTFHFSKNALTKLVERTGFSVISCDSFRPATKFEGGIHKIFGKITKKYAHYPRILTNEKDGKDLRIILKLKDE